MNSLRKQNKAFAKNEVNKTQPPEFSFLMFEQVMNLRHLVFKAANNPNYEFGINDQSVTINPEDYKKYLKYYNASENPSKLKKSKVFKAILNYEKYKSSTLKCQSVRLMSFVTEKMCKNINLVD